MKMQIHGILIRSHRGSVINLVLIGLLGLILLSLGAWVYLSGDTVSEQDEPLTAFAFRGLFIKEVLDQGEIQSSENVEIRSQVKSRYGSRGVTVKRVIEEGTVVKGGDVLVELRSDEIKENFDNQTIEVNNAEDSVTAARNNLDSAEAALKEYQEGLYKEALTLVLNQISQAEEDLERAEEYFKFSTKLQAKNFISRTQLRADRAAVERAKRTLDAAETSKRVLQEHTLTKNMTELTATKTIAESKLTAAENNLKIEEDTLAEIKAQLDACTVRCPEGESGQVVHANIFSRRGSSEFILEEGATVREGQVLIRLPNPKKMQVRATVNESRVTSIDEDMSVKITVDALNGRELKGQVRKVNTYAEPEGWGGGGVRKYAVFIDILNPTKEIRPGMNSSVLIETERIENALLLPIQTVYGYRGKTFCLVKKGEQWKTVEVAVGPNNDTNVVIESGLDEGDEVAMNPAAFKSLLDLPDLPETAENENVDSGQSKRGRGQKNNKRESKREENSTRESKDESSDGRREDTRQPSGLNTGARETTDNSSEKKNKSGTPPAATGSKTADQAPSEGNSKA